MMNRESVAWIVFALGLVPMGLVYYPVKELIATRPFILVAIVYLVLLRWLSTVVAERFEK